MMMMLAAESIYYSRCTDHPNTSKQSLVENIMTKELPLLVQLGASHKILMILDHLSS